MRIAERQARKEVAEAAFAPIARSVTKIADNLEAQSASVANSASNLQQALNRSAEQLSGAADVRADASEAARAHARSDFGTG